MGSRKSPYKSYKKLTALLLVCAIVLSTQGELFAAKEDTLQNDTYIVDLNLKKEINRTLNLEIEKENAEIAKLQEQIATENADSSGSEDNSEQVDAQGEEETPSAEEKPDVPTPNVPSAERKELRAEEQEITKEDLEKLTALDASNKKIQNIAGLEYAINLKTVNLDGNEIADISPLGSVSNLEGFSANEQTVKLKEQSVDEAVLKVSNPLKGLDMQRLTEISGEEVAIEEDTIIFNNLQDGSNEREVSFAKEYEKGRFSGKLVQQATVALREKENLEKDKKEKEHSQADEEERSGRTARSARADSIIYQRQFRTSLVQNAGIDVSWNPDTKELSGKSWYATAYNIDTDKIYVGLSNETDEAWSGRGFYPSYSQGMTRLARDGRWGVYSGDAYWDEGGGMRYTFQARTGSLLYVSRNWGDYYWNGGQRYDDRMNITYTEPGARYDTEHFKILADGSMRREIIPTFRKSQTILPYLNTTLKVHGNDMIVLGDDFLSTTGDANQPILLRLEDSSGNLIFENTTAPIIRNYERFEDLQGIKLGEGYRLRLINFATGKETLYTYNWGKKTFQVKTDHQNIPTPDGTYLIELTGLNNSRYDLVIEEGLIKSICWTNKGRLMHSGWDGKVYLSLGIFKANGDLKKKAAIIGNNHTMTPYSDVGRLKGTKLEDGDELVLYAARDSLWDESSRVRILGNVENAITGLNDFVEKPGFNEKIFRYSASTKKLSQEDGTIADMDPALKTKLESIVSSNPFDLIIKGNGNKKAWLLSLFRKSNEYITFGGGTITKLTGLEYAVNVSKLSIADNPYDMSTYHSLRNMKELTGFNTGGIGMAGSEKTAVDILLGLPNLEYIYLGHNGIRDATEFGRLSTSKVADLNLEYNELENADFFIPFKGTTHIRTLHLNNNHIESLYSLWEMYGGASQMNVDIYAQDQSIERQPITLEHTNSYEEMVRAEDFAGHGTRNIHTILPDGKGYYSSGIVKWNDLVGGTRELGYSFTFDNPNSFSGLRFRSFSGTVKIPVEPSYEVGITAGIGGSVKYQFGTFEGVVDSGDDVSKFQTFLVPVGTKVVLEAKEKYGYRFDGWREMIGQPLNPNKKIEFEMPERDVTYRANFTKLEPRKLTITANPKGKVKYEVGNQTGIIENPYGSAGISREFVLVEGENIRVEAIPLGSDVRFEKWNDNDTNAVKTLKMPDNNLTLRANFREGKILTIDPNGGTFKEDGSSAAKTYFIPKGEPIKNVVPVEVLNNITNTGRVLTHWERTDTGQTFDPSNAFNEPLTTDLTITAIWRSDVDAITLISIPRGIDLKSNGSGELTGGGTVQIVDSVDQNENYANLVVRATPKIRLANEGTTDFYEASVYTADGSQYTDGRQPLMKLHPKGEGHSKQESFTLKAPNTSVNKLGRYTGNMVFEFEWE